MQFLESQLENAAALIASQVDALQQLKQARGEIVHLHEAHTAEVQQLQDIAHSLRCEASRYVPCVVSLHKASRLDIADTKRLL